MRGVVVAITVFATAASAVFVTAHNVSTVQCTRQQHLYVLSLLKTAACESPAYMTGANASPVCVRRADASRVYGAEASSSTVFVTAASGSTAYVTGAFLSPAFVAGAFGTPVSVTERVRSQCS